MRSLHSRRRRDRVFCLLFGLLFGLQAAFQELAWAAPEDLRLWTDVQGRTLRATCRGLEDGVAILTREDGQTARIPLRNFSPEDRRYLQETFAPVPPPPKTATAPPPPAAPAVPPAGQAGHAVIYLEAVFIRISTRDLQKISRLLETPTTAYVPAQGENNQAALAHLNALPAKSALGKAAMASPNGWGQSQTAALAGGRTATFNYVAILAPDGRQCDLNMQIELSDSKERNNHQAKWHSLFSGPGQRAVVPLQNPAGKGNARADAYVAVVTFVKLAYLPPEELNQFAAPAQAPRNAP